MWLALCSWIGITALACDPIPTSSDSQLIPPQHRPIVFRVNDQPVYREVFDHLYEQAVEAQTTSDESELTSEQHDLLRTKIRDQLAREELEFQYAIDQGYASQEDLEIEIHDEMRSIRPMIERQIKKQFIDQMLQQEFISRRGESGLEDYYEDHLEDYQEEMVILQQLTVADGALGMDIKQQVSEGASFTEMVAAHSTDRFRDREGRPLGPKPVSFEQLSELLPQKFIQALAPLDAGEIIGPSLVTKDKHVLLYIEYKEVVVHPLEAIRDQVLEDAMEAFKMDFRRTLWEGVTIEEDGSRASLVETSP